MDQRWVPSEGGMADETYAAVLLGRDVTHEARPREGINNAK